MGTLFGVDGELLERQYRNHLSGYLCWEQLPHAEEWLLFEKNIGAYVGLDEVCLSRGELYTVLINKERKRPFGQWHMLIAAKRRYHNPPVHQNAGISPSLKLSLIYFFTASLWKIFTNFW